MRQHPAPVIFVALTIILVIIGVLFFFVLRSAEDAPKEKGNDREGVRTETPEGVRDASTVTISGVMLRVTIADTPEKRRKGLSGTEKLEEDEGMLFLFPKATRPSIWMKDMHFPIDIIWIDGNALIIEITKDVSPDSFPRTFSPQSPARAVLEVNAEWAEKHAIKTGAQVEGIHFK